MSSNITFSVFTKPWKTQTIDELGALVRRLGFDGIEFPLRNGYQVKPEDAEEGLPVLVRKMAEYGVSITSVASSTDEKVFAGCAAAGIPIIRIMADIDIGVGYHASEEKLKKEIDAFLPLCVKYGVKVGIQMHYGNMISNSMELYHLLEGYEAKHVCGIWDAAHSALAGEEPEQGLSIMWPKLGMVNLKNAFYRRINSPEAETAEWDRYFTLGSQGLASWQRIASYLKSKAYEGVVCLTAEYSDERRVDTFTAKDITYAKSLFK